MSHTNFLLYSWMISSVLIATKAVHYTLTPPVFRGSDGCVHMHAMYVHAGVCVQVHVRQPQVSFSIVLHLVYFFF